MRIDQGLDHGTKISLFPNTTTFFKVFCFSQHFPDFPTYHKIPNFFPISRPGGDPESNYRVKIWHVIYSSNKNQIGQSFLYVLKLFKSKRSINVIYYEFVN